MQMFPRSLIQIHYHNRLGGVRQVMAQYGEAFRRCFNSRADDYWFCRQSYEYNGKNKTVDIPDADYHSFISAGAFQRTVERCKTQLMKAFTSVTLEYPVAVVGHNLNLGKNPALSEAFRRCAGELGRDPDRFRFFLVMHDFAEQGRLDLLSTLQRLAEQGIDVFSSLYASGAPVRFIALGSGCAERTGLGKSYCSVLPNTVASGEAAPSTLNKKRIREQLHNYAKKHRIAFDSSKPLFTYPSRMIYRKNMLEALLLASVVWDGTLVTGKCGLAPGDRKMFRLAGEIAQQYALSLITDPSEIIRNQSEGNPFIPFYKCADYVISTSVAEGFGFGLHEPWWYDCPVVCRQPSGFSFLPGLQTPSVYMKLPIPASWIDCDKVYSMLSGAYCNSFKKKYWSKKQFQSEFISEDTVDFSRIGIDLQGAILKRILKYDSARADLTGLLQKKHNGWPGSRLVKACDSSVKQHNRSLLAQWNIRHFDNEFVKVFKETNTCIAPENWYERIREDFSKPENFQPIVFNRYSVSSQSE